MSLYAMVVPSTREDHDDERLMEWVFDYASELGWPWQPQALWVRRDDAGRAIYVVGSDADETATCPNCSKATIPCPRCLEPACASCAGEGLVLCLAEPESCPGSRADAEAARLRAEVDAYVAAVTAGRCSESHEWAVRGAMQRLRAHVAACRERGESWSEVRS